MGEGACVCASRISIDGRRATPRRTSISGGQTKKEEAPPPTKIRTNKQREHRNQGTRDRASIRGHQSKASRRLHSFDRSSVHSFYDDRVPVSGSRSRPPWRRRLWPAIETEEEEAEEAEEEERVGVVYCGGRGRNAIVGMEDLKRGQRESIKVDDRCRDRRPTSRVYLVRGAGIFDVVCCGRGIPDEGRAASTAAGAGVAFSTARTCVAFRSAAAAAAAAAASGADLGAARLMRGAINLEATPAAGKLLRGAFKPLAPPGSRCSKQKKTAQLTFNRFNNAIR